MILFITKSQVIFQDINIRHLTQYIPNSLSQNLVEDLMHKLYKHIKHSILKYFRLCETVVNSLGFGWLMALCAPGVHRGTVFLAMRMFLTVTKYQPLMKRFKEGSANGGWLQVTQ
jgi:hypothetical protein